MINSIFINIEMFEEIAISIQNDHTNQAQKMKCCVCSYFLKFYFHPYDALMHHAIFLKVKYEVLFIV